MPYDIGYDIWYHETRCNCTLFLLHKNLWILVYELSIRGRIHMLPEFTYHLLLLSYFLCGTAGKRDFVFLGEGILWRYCQKIGKFWIYTVQTRRYDLLLDLLELKNQLTFCDVYRCTEWVLHCYCSINDNALKFRKLIFPRTLKLT